MFLSFLAGLVLLSFSFRLLLIIIGLPLELIFAFLSRNRDVRTGTLSVIINQVILSVVFSGFIAIICLLYASHPSIQHSWFYATCGFIATFLALSSNVQNKRQEIQDSSAWTTPEGEGAFQGAGIGLLAGLVAYPVFYNVPQIVGVIPGAVSFFEWTIRLADWLTEFWIVRAILGLTIVGYVLNAGFMALIGGFMLLAAGWAGLKRMFGKA